MALSLFIEGVAVWAQGLPDWATALPVLRGEQPLVPQPLPLPAPTVLHAAERRRAPASVKLAVHVAQLACDMAKAAPSELPCVFASSHGDTEISDYMCDELSNDTPALSPTKFHNSVHNAASGYWTIAVGCMQPANAISAGACSFAAGLLEAAALAHSEQRAVLLAAYDMAAPAKILPLCPIPDAFAMALVLSPTRTAQSLAELTFLGQTSADAGAEATNATDQFAWLNSNPAARALPLLQALARGASDTLLLTQASTHANTVGNSLAIDRWEITLCQ